MRELIVVRHQANVPLAALEPGLEGVAWRYLDAWTDPEWPRIKDVAGLVVLGGKMSALDDDEYPFLKQVRELMSDAIDHDIPVLGSCLGSQLLAQVLGGEVYRMDAPEVGFVEVKPTPAGAEDPLIGALEGAERVLVWHEDTYTLPPGTTLLASSELAERQAFKVGSAYGLQFHIEATRREINEWAAETDPEELRDWWGVELDSILADAAAYLPAQIEAAERLTGAYLELLPR